MQQIPLLLLLDESEANQKASKNSALPDVTANLAVAKKCRHCEKALSQKLARQGRHFCNSECYWKWLSPNQCGRNNPAWKADPIALICEQCGKPFGVTVAVFKKQGGRYCSITCAAMARRGSCAKSVKKFRRHALKRQQFNQLLPRWAIERVLP